MFNEGLSSLCREDHEELWQPAWGVRTGKLFAVFRNLYELFLQPFSAYRASFHLKAKLQLVWDR
jgi:hypothetical protein